MDLKSNSEGLVKWGIISTGKICKQFASCFKNSKNASNLNKNVSKLYQYNSITAVLSRNQNTASEFAKEFQLPPDVAVSNEKDFFNIDFDIVYIGSVNTEHYRHCKISIENGKSVLCEKPFIMKSEEAIELKNLAKEKGVFMMEGLWTRFFPIHQSAKKIINSGLIGDIKFINSDLGFNAGPINCDHRLIDPSKGGSAIRDVGIYVLHMISFYLNDRKFDEVKSLIQIGETGVDYGCVFAIKSGDAMATANSSFYANTNRLISIFGTKGNIVIENIHKPHKMTITIFSTNVLTFESLTAIRVKPDRVEYDIEIPYYFCGNGLEYEIEHVNNCLKLNKTESDIIPLDTSIYIQSLIDDSLTKK